MNPEGWPDGEEEEGLPDEQPEEEDCAPADLLRMPQENLPE